jgi:hypothetical protein
LCRSMRSCPAPEAVAAIKQTDVVVDCIDNYYGRAHLHSLASRLLVPYVDIRLMIDPKLRSDPAREEHSIGGNVYTLMSAVRLHGGAPISRHEGSSRLRRADESREAASPLNLTMFILRVDH